jgi:membrane-bound inhibitor of C-type lysozyme
MGSRDTGVCAASRTRLASGAWIYWTRELSSFVWQHSLAQRGSLGTLSHCQQPYGAKPAG